MSNTEPSLDRQRKRHAGPLIGMAVVVLFALGYLLWWIYYEVDAAPQPQGAEEQVDGRTGEVTETEPVDPTTAP